jgi:hypothetical protein
VFIDLGDSSAEEGPDEKFPSLDFGLDDDEGEVCFRVHVASHTFYELDLLLYSVGAAFD